MPDSDEKSTLRFDRGTLLLGGVLPEQPPQFSRPGVWKWDDRVGQWRCDAIWYSAIRESGGQIDDQVAAWVPVSFPRVHLHKLREEQERALQAWMTTKRGVVVMPTGTGKTEVALTAASQLGVSTLIVAPVRDLMYQWHQKLLKGLGYDAGIIGDNTYNRKPVSVTTYDSACIHMDELGSLFKLLIFDEAHHLPGDIRRDAARMSAAPYRLGLTATPERSDGRHVDLNELIGPVVFKQTMAEAKGQTLADYEIFKIPVHLTDEEQARYRACSDEVRRYRQMRVREDRDFSWETLRREGAKDPESRKALKSYYTKQSIEDRAQEKLRVLEDLFRLHPGSRVLVFTGSNVMAREVSRRFLVPCLLHHCGKKERADILDGFRKDTYPVIVANQVLDEGVDIPEVKVGIVIGGKTSVKQAKQRLGRIVRKQGDAKAILYEVVCQDTKEEHRSRLRRKSDAYEGTRHRRV